MEAGRWGPMLQFSEQLCVDPWFGQSPLQSLGASLADGFKCDGPCFGGDHEDEEPLLSITGA